MANVKLFDQTGKEVSTVELNDAIFGIEPNESVVFDVVISQRATLSIDSKVLVIVEEGNKFAELSARNLANVTVATPATASVLDIVNADKLLVTKEAISSIEEVLA